MLFEGDTVLFYCAEAKGYVYSNPPWPAASKSAISKGRYTHVTIQSCGLDTVGSTARESAASTREPDASTREPDAEPGASKGEPDASTREPDAEPGASKGEPDASTREPDAEPGASKGEPDASAREPDASTREPDASTREPGASTREPDASTREPDASTREPDVSTKEPDASVREPDASTKEPDASVREPDASTKEPDASVREPDASTKEPDVSPKESDTSTDTSVREYDTPAKESDDSTRKADAFQSTRGYDSSTRDSDKESNPFLPCIQFAAFRIVPALDHTCDTEYTYKTGNTKMKPYRRPLVYGRKVKLYHRASGMYMHLSPPTDKNKNPVGMLKLAKQIGRNEDTFRILPAGKDRGQDVQIEDTIILECLAMKGHHVFFAKNSLTQRYEMKLGVAYSPLTICAHTTDQSDLFPRAVKSGDVVWLFNLEHHAYLSCKGSFACDMIPLASNEFAVTVKSLKNRRGVQKPPPTSGDAFWQLEQFAHPLTGNQLTQKENYRIKHLSTQQYLAVIKQDSSYTVCLRKLTLVTDMSDVCFHLARIDRNSKESDKITKGCYVEIRHSRTNRPLSIDVNKDTCTLFNLVLVERDTTHDHLTVFKLEEVKPEVVKELYCVIGCVQVLNDYMKFMQDTPSFRLLLDEFENTLTDIKCWLEDASRTEAKMLHTTMLVDQLMFFLESMDTSNKGLMTLCETINNVLVQYLKCSDKKLHSYLAGKKFIKILLKKIGCGSKAESVLIELIKDDINLAISVMEQLTTDREVKLQLTSETLELLSSMCFGAGKPLERIQKIILEQILKKDGELYHTQLRDDGTVCFTTPEHLKGEPLVELKKKDRKFFIAQIKLLSQICKGGNTDAKKTIVDEKRLIIFEEACAVFRDNVTYAEIQSAYLDFVQAAFVDNALDQSGIDIDNIWRCYALVKVKEDPLEALANTKEFTEYRKEMTQLQVIIEERLKVLSGPQNALFLEKKVIAFNTKLLSVLKSLVAFGFYWKGNFSDGSFDIINCLVELLYICKDKDDKCTLVVINVLHLYFKQLSYLAVGRFIYDFKTRIEDGPSKSLVPSLDGHFGVAGYCCLNIFDDDQKLIGILIKLLQSKSDDVLLRSAQLLFDLYKREQILFNDAANSFLVVNTSLELFDEWVKCGSFVDDDKILLKLHKNSLDEDSLEEILLLLKEWAERCVLNDDSVELNLNVYGAEPNRCLQGMAYSSRLFSQMLNYVVAHCKTCAASEYEHDYELKVIPEACRFLFACVNGNEVAQIFLFEHYFMDLVGATTCGYNIAQMLTEALTDNESLCRRISAPELQQIFKVATSDQTELCTTLQAAMKVSKSSPVILRITQEAIVRLIQDTRTAKYTHFIQRSDRDARLKILMSHDDGSEVMLLVNLVDTMSVCAEGKYYLGKEFCRSVFSVDELLHVLANKRVHLARKKSFAHLLTEAYLHSDKETVCAELANQRKFWAHVEYCALLLERVCSSVPQNDHTIQVALKVLATKHLSLKGWADITVELDSTVNDGNDEVPLSSALFYLWEGGIPLVSAYCSTYCKLKHSGPSSKMYSMLLTPDHLSVLKSFAESLKAICTRQVGVLVTTESQAAMFAHCMHALYRVVDAEDVKTALHQSKNHLDTLKDQESTAAMENYTSRYREEERLNQSFQDHVTRCRETHEAKYSSGNAFLDAILAPITVLPRDKSFKEVVEKFSNEEALKESLKRLLSNHQFRKTKTSRERKELDAILFTCLQLLVSITSAYLPQCERIVQDMSTEAPADEKQLQKKRGMLEDMQKTFFKIEVHKEILLHLSHSREDHVVLSMAFLSTLLHFGNKERQTELRMLLEQRNNMLLLKQMHRILYRASSIVFGGRLPMQLKLKETDRESASASDHVSISMDSLDSNDGNTIDGNTNDEVMETSLTTDDQLSEQYQLPKVVVAKEDAVQNSAVLLDLISWMCDGQNKKMQDLLRRQYTGVSSLNIVGQVATLLVGITDHLDKDTLKIAEHALQALIETCAGNYDNQESAFKAQVVDALNQIFAYAVHSEMLVERVVVQTLQYSALELLEVLLEETDVRSNTLGRAISEDIHVPSVVLCMKSLWEIHEEEIPQAEIHQKARIKNKARRALYKGYHDLLKMGYYLNVPIKSLVPEYDTKESMWDYVTKWSHSVEVECKTTEGCLILTKAYFPFDPEDELTDANKAIIEAKINRESQEDKVKDLLKWVEHIKQDKEHKKKLKQSWFLKWLDFGRDIRFCFLALLTIVMNLFIIILFGAPTSEPDSNDNITISLPITPSWYHNYVIFILGVIHLLLTIWMVLEYFITKQPHFRNYRIEGTLAKIKKYWIENFHRSKKSSKSQNPSDYQLQGYQVDYVSFKPIYTILFLLCSILSLGLQGYFYCFCLFYIFLRATTLTIVLNAVKRSAAQLILVFGVIFVIVYIYSVISFAFLHNFFNKEDGQFCDNLLQCSVSVIRGGLLDTLGSDTISLTTSSMTEPYFTVVALRMVFDISFFIIVTTLGLNIVIAILVDRFSELREERDKIKDDQKKRCFICGISSDSFDEKGQGFRNHIIDDHNKWNYIYFILYLETIPENDRNALEKEVSQKVWVNVEDEPKSIDFFPLHKAKTLPKN